MNININFEYNKDRLSSMFYYGDTIIIATQAECTLEIYTVGHITLYLDEDKFKDSNASIELWKRDFTDDDLIKLNEDDKILENNWFEYIIKFEDPNKETMYSDPLGDIEECLTVLNLFIKGEFENL